MGKLPGSNPGWSILFNIMNREIEVKGRIQDVEKVRAAILKLAKPIKKVRQVDTYYTPAHIDYFAEKHVNKYIRTREQDGTLSFEFHNAVRKDGKKLLSEEYETLVEKPEILKKILGLCEFKKVLVIEKDREYFELDSFELALDRVKGLGDFLEVEAKKMFSTPEETKEKCIELMYKLNPDFDGHLGSYTKMMLKQQAPLWKSSS